MLFGGTSSPSARQKRVGDVEVEVAAGGVEPGGARGADEAGAYGVASGPAGTAGPDPAGVGRERSRPQWAGTDSGGGRRACRGACRHGGEDFEGLCRSWR